MSAAPRLLRRIARPLVLVTTAAVLVLPLSASGAQSKQAERAQQAKVYGKKFAAYEYLWYPIHFVDHFEIKDEPLNTRKWQRQGTRRQVTTQNGMLTIRTTQNQSVGATLRREAHRTGRWEIRLRGQRCAERFNPCREDRSQPGQTEFTVAAELIPARGEGCGARNIALTTFEPQDDQVRYYARNQRGGQDHQFTRSRSNLRLTTDKWHTYAVEVRRGRIAWFMDGKVISTERRRDALSRIPLTFRLQLQSEPNADMHQAQLQVDTVRYFTLKSPRAKRVPNRPNMEPGNFGGC